MRTNIGWSQLGGVLVGLGFLLLGGSTWVSLAPMPTSLHPERAGLRQPQFLDRHGAPLSSTFQNPLNVHDTVPLHAIPAFLQQAFLVAEDKRFYHHAGVDWQARAHALLQNVLARRVVRGASTITEQVVRMLQPRRRTVWWRWVEGFEARRLEGRFPKTAIVEFYLNQVPYARQRRGVVQAARLYFGRDLDTLNQHEMLTLAVLVRAPSRLDLWRDPGRIRPAVLQLAARLRDAHMLSADAYQALLTQDLALFSPPFSVHAEHFLRSLQTLHSPPGRPPAGRLLTTLDSSLQRTATALLVGRLQALRTRGVSDGAVLIVDHHTDEIVAWLTAGGSRIDAVRTPRQPGSTLKPFLYALAVEQGWTAATLLDDSPLSQAVGTGLHTYRNYNGQHYGPLRLREALGNSLNVPAVRAINVVTPAVFLARLHQLGFHSLSQSAEHYGNGLALGNGEVTLFELVQAYATLARQGLWRPLRALADSLPSLPSQHVYSAESSTLIANILADPYARNLEFGRGNLLRFPVETAVKTGTSSDYRDAWAIGFSQRYTAGVWMGNLQQRPMRDVSGSVGPALLLRSLFAVLHQHTDTQPLPLSAHLVPQTICRITGQAASAQCPSMQEWFLPGTNPATLCPLHAPTLLTASTVVPETLASVSLLRPTPGLQLAMDPRIPDVLEVFPLQLPRQIPITRVEWLVDGQVVGSTGRNVRQFPWPLSRGPHMAQARVWPAAEIDPVLTPQVEFIVK